MGSWDLPRIATSGIRELDSFLEKQGYAFFTRFTIPSRLPVP